jgi:hypothetical protein
MLSLDLSLKSSDYATATVILIPVPKKTIQIQKEPFQSAKSDNIHYHHEHMKHYPMVALPQRNCSGDVLLVILQHFMKQVLVSSLGTCGSCTLL